MSNRKVIVVGGGVGGLSAAHHLLRSGFEVEVYEYHDIPGGKARSLGVPGTGKDGRHDLPAEHGFRFFPAYYFHVIETMKEIPFWKEGSGGKVLDDGVCVEKQLVAVDFISFADFFRPPMLLASKFPHTFVGWWRQWRGQRGKPRPRFAKGELRFYFARLWQIMTSCDERRDDEYEVTPWWDYIGAEDRSLNYQRYLANLSRTLVAANPRKVSTRTNGNIYLQTLMGLWGPNADRVLSGPTNEIWIHPWLKYLLSKGLKYYVNAEAVEWLTDQNGVSGVRVKPNPNPRPFSRTPNMARILDVDRYGITHSEVVDGDELIATGDYYVSAVPVERMAQLLGMPLPASRGDGEAPIVENTVRDLDPDLRKIGELAYSVQWMNGMQLYLKCSPGKAEPPNLPGHTIYADAPYALTSIFQPQYWKHIDLTDYGDGTVRNVLSVDISNWQDAKGRIYDMPACDLTRTRVKNEVWEDLKGSLKRDPKCCLADDNLVDWYLDSDIHADDRIRLRNREPLLVNRVNTWRLRPDAATNVANLFLASDYVRTYTDLATMEAANEAARRAVNAILDASGSDAERCIVRPLPQPDLLKPFRDYDLERYIRGERWSNRFPIMMKLRLYWTVFVTLLGLK